MIALSQGRTPHCYSVGTYGRRDLFDMTARDFLDLGDDQLALSAFQKHEKMIGHGHTVFRGRWRQFELVRPEQRRRGQFEFHHRQVLAYASPWTL